MEYSVREHQAYSMSQSTGRNQETAKPDPTIKDPIGMKARALLSRHADDLKKALGNRSVILINRAAEATEAALAEVDRAINTEAAEEAMSPEELDQTLEEHRAPVRELFKRAREVRRQVAAAE